MRKLKGKFSLPLQLSVSLQSGWTALARGEPKAACHASLCSESSPSPEAREDPRKADAPSPENRRGKNREAELFGKKKKKSIWLENSSVPEMKELYIYYREKYSGKREKSLKIHSTEKNNIY